MHPISFGFVQLFVFVSVAFIPSASAVQLYTYRTADPPAVAAPPPAPDDGGATGDADANPEEDVYEVERADHVEYVSRLIKFGLNADGVARTFSAIDARSYVTDLTSCKVSRTAVCGICY